MTTAGAKPGDCIVKVNCIEVKAVPVGLRKDLHPLHKAFLEIIEERGKDGEIGVVEMMNELKKRGYGEK